MSRKSENVAGRETGWILITQCPRIGGTSGRHVELFEGLAVMDAMGPGTDFAG